VLNTTEGTAKRLRDSKFPSALSRCMTKIPYFTTAAGAYARLRLAIKAQPKDEIGVKSLQGLNALLDLRRAGLMAQVPLSSPSLSLLPCLPAPAGS